jgi:hypothetical protein
MSYAAPFGPHGNTVALATNASASTANSTNITDTLLGLGLHATAALSQVLCINRGTSDVWVSFTSATAVIAIPVVGTPSQALNLAPGAYIVFTFQAGPNIWVNDISTGTSQPYYLTFGEGS